VREVIDKMKKHGISQLPVVEGGKLRGLVHEVDLLRHLVQGSGTLDSAVAGLVESDYGTVTPATKVELLQGVLSEAALAIVLDKEMVTGVITKIDLIEFLARHKAPAVP
jgi:cystathionine beta-synthase